ncbi:hypothetical protein DLAC_04668 [Tieghemostelium lacteum]|uniref:Calcium-activated BK potassium channel n=1 Tax=Tieghemostelium lacteum TaxID=361077 RepID=A0A151ZKF6_TIELA|nr:hypothetical protein DLAC_04668 [Tieghemostelium lacteum]|eukprot:KYQ94370.1 hypothetical protein DLAC_04668 [Tieghemostelium lacteum]
MELLSSSIESLPQQPPGFNVIFQHVLLLLLVVFIVLAVLTAITLISRLTRKDKYQVGKKLSLRTRCEVYLTVTGIIQWIEGIQTVLSVLSVIIFIYGTYLRKNPPKFYIYLEFALTIFFTLHWMLDYFIHKDRLKYLYSLFSLVDLFTILPIYIDIANGSFFTELSTFQFLRVLRTFRVLRANRVLHYFNDITQYLLRVVIAIFTFIMIVAAFYMNVDVSPITGGQLHFHETIYFLVVTLTTDGYGDIHPTNAVGQLTITASVIIGAVLIPYQVSKLLEKFNNYSPYKRDLSKDTLHGHIILCGDINFTSLLEFLTEFYLEKYAQLKKTIVILSPTPPSDQLKILLLHPFYKNRLYYLEGSPTIEADLIRTRFSNSSSAFIFRPLFWEEGDSTAILTSLAMKNLKERGPKIFVQLLHHENKYKISSKVKHIMCIEDFRNGILVQSTLCPGFSTLVCNLFTSRQPDPMNDDEKWIGEYCNGAVNSIYKIPVPLALIGETLGYVTSIMYSGAKALVLGIIDDDDGSSSDDDNGFPSIPTSQFPLNSTATQLPTTGGTQLRKNRFVIHPPFSTILTSSMNLIIIAHSPSAPTFKPNVPSIIRKSEDSDLDQSTFRTLYNKLFVPDEARPFSELHDSSDHTVIFNDDVKSFFTSTFTANNNIEMDVLNSNTNNNNIHSIGNTPILSPNSAINTSLTTLTMDNVQTSPKSNLPSPILKDQMDAQAMNEISLNDETNQPIPLVALCNNEFESNWNEVVATVIESIDSKKPHMESIVEDLKPVLESIERNRNLDEYSEEEKEDNNWKEHIIICGSINRIDLFLRGLRQKHISDNINHFYFLMNQQFNININNANHHEIPPIVILHPEEPDMSDWEDIEDVYFVKGSPLERKDLETCKIKLASKIIILSDPYKPHRSSPLTDKTSVQLDSDTIMAYLEINEIFSNNQNQVSFLTVELVHEPNIRFISKNFKAIQNTKKFKKDEEEFEKPNYYITSEFASGKVLTLTTLDSLICQSSHQEYLLDVATELVLGCNGIKNYYKKFIKSNMDSTDSDTDDESEGTSSSGGVNSIQHSLNHTLSQSSANNPNNHSYLHGPQHSHQNHCLLNQIKVPEQFHGHTYGELFEGLIHKNILPLGLYRCKEITGAPNPYVFTCPPSSTTLHENDLVYILYHQNQISKLE